MRIGGAAAQEWALALVGGCVGAVLVNRFKDWAVIILARLVGSVLTMRGISILLPGLDGLLATSLARAAARCGGHRLSG
ncbi:MAG: hypothetical protein HGA45_44835 [Chloroflexales bacterium]|nr:hypothetical protein [Chloroflexales bacterium]